MSAKDTVIIIALSCLWGFNFSAIKLGAMQTDPLLLTALRFTFAVFPAIFFVRRPVADTRYLIAYGLTFGLGVWGMMVSSISLGLSAGMAGLLMNMSIISSIAFGYWIFGEDVTFTKIGGAALAVAGLLVSIALTDGSVPLAAVPLALISAVCWSTMALIVKSSKTEHVFAFSVWGMLFAPLALVTFALVTKGTQPFIALPSQLNSEVWFSILFQAYPTTLFGYWIWNRLTIKYPLSTIAPFSLLTPIFGLIGSVIFFNEGVSAVKLIAYVLILSGLALSQVDSATRK